MFTPQAKRAIADRLKHVSGRGQVFDLINQGGTPEQVESLIQTLLDSLPPPKPEVTLRTDISQPKIWGKAIVAQNAVDDLMAIARLPYVKAAVLMPDGHRVKENHVPVGGVVVTSDAILPSVVGSDIACSVMLTEFKLPADSGWFDAHRNMLVNEMTRNSYFGRAMNPTPAVRDQPFYRARPAVAEMRTPEGKSVLTSIESMAVSDFGTSGDGNHFAEFGLVSLSGRPETRFAILTHFGSRGVGATIAKVFEQAANDLCRMPKGMLDAALYWDTPLGQDYWRLMNWAGDFAEAGHRWLHAHLSEAINSRLSGAKLEPAREIYSRHNFAVMNEYGIVHRKGATPAARDERGVIPATMGHKTRIVRGLGNALSFESASHGAGRTHSRGQAMQAFSKTNKDYIKREFGISLIGGDADEDPRAYKDIAKVMSFQADCVEEIGTFKPMIVRMADPRLMRR